MWVEKLQGVFSTSILCISERRRYIQGVDIAFDDIALSAHTAGIRPTKNGLYGVGAQEQE